MDVLSIEGPLISVIIALYNAEAYLPECIESVKACRDGSIECILINDGSTDSSRDICEAAIAGDSRFRLLNKENSGVSDSRNAGLDAARGDYIFFLDADDYIDETQWQRILEYADTSKFDLVAFGYYSLFSSGLKQKELFRINGETSDIPGDTFHALVATPMLNTCWGKLMRRSVVWEHGICFDTSLVTCEDAVFVSDFIGAARTYLLCNQCVLYYRVHKSSAMRMRSIEHKLEDFRVLYARRTAFLYTHPELRKASYRECFSVLTNLLLEYANSHSMKEVNAVCKSVLAYAITAEILSNVDAGSIVPIYKKLEHTWMRRGRVTLLSFYFRMKSRFLSKQ